VPETLLLAGGGEVETPYITIELFPTTIAFVTFATGQTSAVAGTTRTSCLVMRPAACGTLSG